jgi:hypothetical protein
MSWPLQRWREWKPLNSAVAEAAAARVDEVLPEQVELHELLGFPAHVASDIERRRGGRPAGARNKRLAEVAKLVREQFGDVLLHQVAVATMPIEQLMALGLKPVEAVVEKRLAAATVLPYLEQKQPLKVDLTGKPPVFLTIEMGQGNQGVAAAVGVQLDGAELDGAGNPLMWLDEPAGGQLIEDQAGALPAETAAPPAAPPPAPAVPARAPEAPPGGPVSPPPPVSRAPAGVVPRRSPILRTVRNPNATGPGGGGYIR